MGKQYDSIKTTSLPLGVEIAHPPTLPELIHIDDSVFSVFVDFQVQRSVTIYAKQSIDEAQLEMKANNVHLLLVVDANKHVIGMISSQALHGERPYQIIQEGRVKHSEIHVATIMLPIEQVLCLDYDALKTAKIGNLVETFKKHQRHYALVIKTDTQGKHRIQGYFSASRISRTLSLSNTAGNAVGASTIQELQAMLREFE
ncbi:MAG: CBS domain-containing protein [Pseudomonadota bacterium]